MPDHNLINLPCSISILDYLTIIMYTTYHTPSVISSVLCILKCRVLFSPNSSGEVIFINGGQEILFKKANSIIIPGLNLINAGNMKYINTKNPENICRNKTTHLLWGLELNKTRCMSTILPKSSKFCSACSVKFVQIYTRLL